MEKGLENFFITSRSSYFFNKIDFEQYFFEEICLDRPSLLKKCYRKEVDLCTVHIVGVSAFTVFETIEAR